MNTGVSKFIIKGTVEVDATTATWPANQLLGKPHKKGLGFQNKSRGMVQL